MLKLYGIAFSNYYNKVKLALLEKGIPFEEVATRPSREEAFLEKSPLGKIPSLDTEDGPLSESQVILEYLEERYPERPLYPADPFTRAKCREIIFHLELNVELIARRLYGAAFFGGTASAETRAEVEARVEQGIAGFARLVTFSPYAAGAEFSAVDCAVWPHLGVISRAMERVCGFDLLEKMPGSREYLLRLAERPHFARVAADSDRAIAAFLPKI